MGRGGGGGGKVPATSYMPAEGGGDVPSGVAETIAATTVMVFLVFVLAFAGLFVAVVVALWRRGSKTRRNREECRQLAPRVAWLRDLLQLLRAEPGTPGGPGTSLAVDVRAVLDRRLEAALTEAEGIIEACAGSCCLCRYVRCNRHARQLDGVSKSMDDVYGHILPVLSQIDAAERLLHLLDAMQLQVSQDGPKSATRRSETHQATRAEANDVSERQAATETGP